jgi:glycerophosphoryl diester phosphodiesterase
VIPWTVNEAEEIDAMLDMGVDGIISDYPDRVRTALAARDLPLPPRFITNE